MSEVAVAVDAGRVAAEARMLDTFDIKIPTGPDYNSGAGLDVTTYTLLFSTVGRVKRGLTANEAGAGDREVVTVNRELHIPVDSPAVPVGAVAFVTSVGAGSDPTLSGAALRLTGPAPGSQTTARRLQVTEVLT